MRFFMSLRRLLMPQPPDQPFLDGGGQIKYRVAEILKIFFLTLPGGYGM